MKRRPKFLLLVGIFVGIVAIVLLLIPTSNRKQEAPDSQRTNFSNALTVLPAANGPTNEFKILSDQLTSTGRVYVVSKDGITRTSVVPSFVDFTKQQLEEFSFGSSKGSNSPVPQSGGGVNRQLLFYGIALDEKTNGVAGASVEANVLVNRPDEVATRETYSASTGPDGRFSLDIPWGQQMMVTVTAGTNYIGPAPQWFQYGAVGSRPIHYPNPRDPVVFFFQTRNPPESLFSFDRRFRAPNDGQPVRVDLTNGKLVPSGGDLIVSIYCPEPYTNLRQFPWRLLIEVANGGIFEINGGEVRMEYLYEAPASGYQTGIHIEYGPNSGEYRRQHEGWYYVQSRNGQVYAKLRFDMTTRWDEHGVPFGIRAVVNTNGSRNLQTPVN